MMEAKITCICGSIDLPDLGLHLTKGMTVYLDAPKARSSKDVQRAWRAKGITLQYVERFQERRAAEVSNPVFPPPPTDAGFVRAPRDEVVLMDPDAIAQRVVAEFGNSPVSEKIRVEVGRQLQVFEERIAHRVARQVLEALRAEPLVGVRVGQESSGMAAGTPVPTGTVSEDVPVFIPTRFGQEGMKAEVSVKTQRGEDDLADAAEALRAMRRGKRE